MKRQKKRRLLFSLCGVLLIGIAAIFIVLLRNSRQQNAASVQNMQLTNIGAFHFNTEYESLTLPGGLSGTGIKVSASDGTMIPAESRVSTHESESLSFVTTLYNAQDLPNTVELLVFIDNRQAPYMVGEDAAQQWNVRTVMPAASYLHLPLTIDLTKLPIEEGLHDIWFVCEYFADQKTDYDKRQPYFQTNYHLKLVHGTGDVWSAVLLDDTNKHAVDKEMRKKFDHKMMLQTNREAKTPFSIEGAAGEEVKATLTLYDRKENVRYQTFVMLNGRAVPLSHQGDSVIWVSSPESSSSFSFPFRMPSEGDSNKIYAITFPLANENVVFTSERMNVELLEK